MGIKMEAPEEGKTNYICHACKCACACAVASTEVSTDVQGFLDDGKDQD